MSIPLAQRNPLLALRVMFGAIVVFVLSTAWALLGVRLPVNRDLAEALPAFPFLFGGCAMAETVGLRLLALLYSQSELARRVARSTPFPRGADPVRVHVLLRVAVWGIGASIGLFGTWLAVTCGNAMYSFALTGLSLLNLYLDRPTSAELNKLRAPFALRA